MELSQAIPAWALASIRHWHMSPSDVEHWHHELESFIRSANQQLGVSLCAGTKVPKSDVELNTSIPNLNHAVAVQTSNLILKQ